MDDDMYTATCKRYRDIGAMATWLGSPSDVRTRLWRAFRALDVSKRPMGRFGLASAEDVPPEVRALIEGCARKARQEARPMADLAERMRESGAAWDEVWAEVRRAHPGSGFYPGDSWLLPEA